MEKMLLNYAANIRSYKRKSDFSQSLRKLFV